MILYLATICFGLAVIHTFSVKIFQNLAHRFPEGSIQENLFHYLGEIEVVFGIWAAVFFLGFCLIEGREPAYTYMDQRSFGEPILVFVLMVLCSTQPILRFAGKIINLFSRMLPFKPTISFYLTSLVIGPLLGSLITEPAAMTVTAFILLERFYSLGPSEKLKYSTLGLLFVNVSVGGVLTSFAAPPVLMVAAKWGWDTAHMFTHFGWKAAAGIIVSTVIVTWLNRRELGTLGPIESFEEQKKMPVWVTLTHLGFLVLVILNHTHPPIFVALFLFFLGFVTITREFQDEVNLRGPLLVGFFLAGLVVLGGMQSWWLQPLLTKLDAFSLYVGAAGLTAVADNAAITYLGSQVEGLSEISRYALVAGSVVGGGITVIANAPNPAGYAILNSSFGREGIGALALLKSALLPTLCAALALWVL